jgi:hypothetical protein
MKLNPASRKLFFFHLVSATLGSVIAVVLYWITLGQIRQLHPDYPYRVVLSLTTPPAITQLTHSLGLILFIVGTPLIFVFATILATRQRRPAKMQLVLICIHLLLLVAGIFLLSVSALRYSRILSDFEIQ